jgi:hypothetical protein
LIGDVVRAIAAMLSAEQIAGVSPTVAFEAPKKDWAAARTSPTLNLFLADIREDLTRRTTTLVQVSNPEGVVEYYRQPFRFYDLTFTLTAWTNRPEDDYALLGLALICLNRYDYLPPSFCSEALQAFLQEGHVLNMRVGGKIFSDRFATELFSAMGTDYHAIVSVVVTLPVPAGVPEPAGPPQTQPPRIGVTDTRGPSTDEILGRDPKNPDAGIRTRSRATQ